MAEHDLNQLRPSYLVHLRRLAHLIALLWLSSCVEQAVEIDAGSGDVLSAFHELAVPELAAIVELRLELPRLDAGASEAESTRAATAAPPYVCERFEVRIRPDGRSWHKRLRDTAWTKAERERFRELVELVAEELDADPRLLTLWALRESTYNPHAIHVLDPDLEASRASWRAHRWDPKRAAELEATMSELGARHPDYWKAKAELARISKFRDNPHYEATIDFEVVDPTERRHATKASAWGYGYGPFGFNPTYFLPIWDASAPPWVFCNDDGLAAIVTAVWAAREHQRECETLGFDGSYEVVNRRFASGHCTERPGRAEQFRTRARSRGIDPAARARLGKRWPRETSNRRELLEHLYERARERGLLSEQAQGGLTLQ